MTPHHWGLEKKENSLIQDFKKWIWASGTNRPISFTRNKVRYWRKNGYVNQFMITIDGERKREHSSQDKHNGGSSTGEKGGAFRSQSTGLPSTHRLRLWSGEEEGEKRTPAYRQAF